MNLFLTVFLIILIINNNVEKIGNIVPQLHIHIIVRRKTDSTWPSSVWIVKGKPYATKVLKDTLDKIKLAFK